MGGPPGPERSLRSLRLLLSYHMKAAHMMQRMAAVAAAMTIITKTRSDTPFPSASGVGGDGGLKPLSTSERRRMQTPHGDHMLEALHFAQSSIAAVLVQGSSPSVVSERMLSARRLDWE
eukprot:scaffold36267_cov112-Isochrysis_galbana.AAC.1